MGFAERNNKTIIVALVLLGIFLFPIVYNPLHHLFVKHFHYTTTEVSKIDSFHNSCKLDDFSLDKSSDIELVSCLVDVFIKSRNQLREIEVIFLAYHNFVFLLRAPPGHCAY
jgi:hypothetical protein